MLGNLVDQFHINEIMDSSYCMIESSRVSN